MKPYVKICCISSVEEAQMAIKSGASYLGLVGPMPSGPGVISLELINTIHIAVNGKANTVFLTSKTSFEDICEEYDKVQTSHIQLTDHTSPEVRERLNKKYRHLRIIQVVHVIDESSIAQAVSYEPTVDYLLLDSGNPNLAVKELGGTGKTHNWDVSKDLIEAVDVPVFLAGGLKSANVASAIESVEPYGLDLCSGVRTEGHLDQEKLSSFFEQVNQF